MTDQETASAEALRAEYERLEQAHADADELPDDVDQRLGEIETALAALDDRPVRYDPDEIARAGVFISIDSSGDLRIERGYVRPEDEPAVSSVRLRRTTQAASVAADAATDGSRRARSTVVRQNPRTSRSRTMVSSLFRIG